MRYRLRTLLIVLALGPPVLAGGWLVAERAAREYRAKQVPKIKGAGSGVISIPVASGTYPIVESRLESIRVERLATESTRGKRSQSLAE